MPRKRGEGMPVYQYRRSLVCQAIQFNDPSQVQEIIDFVGLPVSVDFTADGVRLRVIRGALDVVVAEPTDYIVKHSDGKLEAVHQDIFEEEYELME